jgi:hypothetical protein
MRHSFHSTTAGDNLEEAASFFILQVERDSLGGLVSEVLSGQRSTGNNRSLQSVSGIICERVVHIEDHRSQHGH